jgi:hypothetical protein
VSGVRRLARRLTVADRHGGRRIHVMPGHDEWRLEQLRERPHIGGEPDFLWVTGLFGQHAADRPGLRADRSAVDKWEPSRSGIVLYGI